MRAALRPGWPLAFAACVLAACLGSLALGKDVNWDLRNYHYYVAFALLEGRLGFDLAPAQIQTYFNPLADLPFYALVAALKDPRAVALAMALPTAVAAFFLLRLLALMFPRGIPQRMLCIVAAALVGLTTATGSASLGSTMNDWLGAAFVMPGLYLAARAVAGDVSAWRMVAAAGLLVGFATGLKLTHAPFCIGLVAGLLVTGAWRQRLARGQAAVIGLATGFLLAYGWWGLVLQAEFGSPFFPFLNGFFKSPWWEIHSWFDARFGPQGSLETLAFPLVYSRHPSRVSHVSFRDYRLAALFVLGACVLVSVLLQRRRGPRFEPRRGLGEAWSFLACFTLASYVAWLGAFAIHRYLLVLEMLSGALLVAAVVHLLRAPNARRVAIVVLALLIVGTTRTPGWERAPFDDAYLKVQVPEVAAGALVVIGYNVPASYAIPFFPRETRFAAPSNNFLSADQRNLLVRRIAQAIATHAGPYYLLEERARPSEAALLARHALERVGQSCGVVRSNLDADALQLCRLEPRAASRASASSTKP